MSSKYGVLLFLWFLYVGLMASLAVAQDSADYEQKTRLLFEQAQWEQLVEVAAEALDRGYESYAIRYRFAIALLETGRWNKADEALVKLVAINPFDPYSKQLLVNHYLKTGRALQADRIQKGSLPTRISIQYGRAVPDVESIGVMQYVDATFAHRLFQGSQLTWSAGSLNQPVYWGDISQINAYLRYDQALAGGWSLSSAVNVLDFSKGLSDTLGFGGRATVLGAGLRKRMAAIQLSADASTSDLYGRRQWQTSLGLSLYPGRFASWMIKTEPLFMDDGGEQNLGLNSSIHWYSTAHTEIALSFYTGKARNYTENMVYVVNNSLDLTQHKLGLYLQRDITPQLQAFLLLEYATKRERFFEFDYNTQQWFTGLSVRL
jgi:tetratricopeptide (TPR) repeat protein